MKNLITSLKFIAKASLFVFAFVLFSQTADAAFKLNDGGQSLCKEPVRVTKSDPTVYDSNTYGSEYLSQTVNAGDYVYVHAFAANIGNSSGNVTFSTDVYQNTASTSHTIHVNVGGSQKTVTVDISGNAQTLTLDGVNTGTRIMQQNNVPTTVFSYSGYTGVSQSSTSWATSLSQISGAGTSIVGCPTRGTWSHWPVVPQNNSGYEKMIVWRYKVGTNGGGGGGNPSNIDLKVNNTSYATYQLNSNQNLPNFSWTLSNVPNNQSCQLKSVGTWIYIPNLAIWNGGNYTFTNNDALSFFQPGQYGSVDFMIICAGGIQSNAVTVNFTQAQQGGNPPVVSNIQQNGNNLTWSATNSPATCSVDYWNGGNAWDTSDNTAPYSISIPSTTPGLYQGSITCTNQYGNDNEQFSYTLTNNTPQVAVDITFVPISVLGTNVPVTWTSSSANSCSLFVKQNSMWNSYQLVSSNIGTTGPDSISSSFFTQNGAGSYIAKIECSNASGSAVDTYTFSITAPSAPSIATTLSITGTNGQTGSSATITQGQSATINYSVNGTNGAGSTPSCIATKSTGGSWVNITGNVNSSVSTGTQNTVGQITYYLTCTYSGVSSGTKQVVLNVQSSGGGGGTPPVVSNPVLSGNDLVWSVTNSPTSCTIDYYNGGSSWDTMDYSAPWSVAIPSTTPGTYTGQIKCTNQYGTSPWVQFSYTLSSQTTSVVATASPTSVTVGNQSTISWTGTGVNLNSCTVQKKNNFSVWINVATNVSSGYQVTPVLGQNFYRVVCFATSNGAAVNSNQVTVSATAAPVGFDVTLTANGQHPSLNSSSGQQVNLQWTVTGNNLSYCTRTWIAANTTAYTGFTYVYPTQTTTYTITCYPNNGGTSGAVSESVTVYIGTSGNQLEVTTDSNVDNVTDSSARIYGNLVNDGSGNVTLWFEVTTNSNPTCSFSNATSEHLSQTGVNGATPFYKTVSGLDSDQLYYYRACGMDSTGTVDSGIIFSFRTEDDGSGSGSFSISTLSPEDEDENSATLRGEVNNEDDVDVWFTYSSSDSTPECDGNDTETYLSSSYDDGEEFEKSISGLSANRTYYYRACGEKGGTTEEGNVRSFRTDNNNDDNNDDNNGNGLPIITTLFPGSIGFDSANLQATVNANGCSVTTWFKYSTAAALSQPQQTAPHQQGNISGVVSDSVTNLLPGITYYVTAYAQNCRGTVSGGTISFRTVGQTPIDYGTYDYDTNTNTTRTIVQYIGGGNGADWLKLDIDDNSTSTTVGQMSQYKVTWENITNSTLRDVQISVVFPKQLQVIGTTMGQVASDGSVIVQLGTIDGKNVKDGNYKGELFVTTRARSIAAGTVVVAQAIATFDAPNKAKISAIDYDQNTVFNNGLFGAAAFGTGPFGLGVIGWILLLLAILLIFLIARYAAMSRNNGYYAPQYLPHQYPPQQLYYQQPQQPMYVQPMMYTQQAAPAPAPARQNVAPVVDLPTEEAVDGYEYKPYRPTYPQE